MCSWGGLLRVCRAGAQHCNLTLEDLEQRKHIQEMPWAAMAGRKQIGLGIGWAEIRMTWRE